MDWIRRQRDRALFAVGIMSVVAAAVVLYETWHEVQTVGELSAPPGWRLPPRERVAFEGTTHWPKLSWGVRERNPFREKTIVSSGPEAVELMSPQLPPPEPPLPPPATGALRPVVHPILPSTAAPIDKDEAAAAPAIPMRLPPECTFEVIEDDMVLTRGSPSYYVGEILSESDTEIVFRTTTGITARFQRGDVLDVKRKTSVEQAYQNLHQEAGANAQKHFELGLVCLGCDLVEWAEAQFREAIRLDPAFGDAYEQLALLRRNAGDAYGELAVSQAAAATARNPLPFLMRSAELFEAVGLPERAAAQYRAAAKASPADVECRLRLAELYLEQNRAQEAAVLFGEVLALEARNARAMDGMGRVALMQGKLDEARNWFQRAALDLTLAHPRNGLGAIVQLEGRFDQALEAYENALRVDENMPYAHINRACLILARDRAREARKSLEEAAKGLPADSIPLGIARGYLNEVLRQPHEAAAHYRQVLEREPANVYALCGLGRTLLVEEQIAEALEKFRVALLFDPKYTPALEGATYAAFKLGDMEAAAETAEALVELQPSRADALARAAVLHLHTGRSIEHVQETVRKALEAMPDQPLALTVQAFLAWQAGDYRKALETFDRAVRLGDPTGYAQDALAALQAADDEVYWVDRFDRPGGGAESLALQWTEEEGDGIVIRVTQNRLHVQGIREGRAGRSSLIRKEKFQDVPGTLARIEATLEVPPENEAIVALRLGTRNGEVLFGVTPERRLVYATVEGQAEPNFIPISVAGRPATAGYAHERVVLKIEIVNAARGMFQVYSHGREELLATPLEVRRLARANELDVGLVAFTAANRQCLFWADSFRVVRRKTP